MNKLEVYFSKLPKDCLECPCFQNDEMCCGLDDGTQDFFKDEIDGGKCPLKKFHSKATTQNKLKIVREVCEKIKDKALGLWYFVLNEQKEYFEGNRYLLSRKDFYEILNQIQKEYEFKNGKRM